MKKHFSIFAALVAAMAAVSCVQEEAPVTIPQEENNNPAIFTASFSEDATKATLNDDYSVAWEDADQVGIFAAAATPHLYVAELMDEAGAKASLTTEEEVGAAETFYAIYPYDADATIADGVITTELPAVQTAVKDDFAHHLAVSSTDNYTFKFKNVCGLVKVTVNTSDVVSVVLEGRNNEVVAGGVKVAVGNEPTWVADGAKGSKTVTLKAEADGVLAKGTYYFAVLPQTFENGFTVTSNKKNGEPVVRTVSSKVTVKRAKIVTGNANGIAGKGTEAEPYIIMTAQDMCDMKGLTTPNQMTYFKLGADIDMSGVKEWETINGKSPYNRYVHFDGAKNADPKAKEDCYTISNFKPTNITGGYPSIFGVLNGTVVNLNVEAADIKNTVSTGAGIIGGSSAKGDGAKNIPESTELQNVHVKGSVTNSGVSDASAGGLLGRCYVTAVIVDCTADVKITTNERDNGGLIGRCGCVLTMSGCETTVDMKLTRTDAHRSGGLIGYFYGASADIQNCKSFGVLSDRPGITAAKAAVVGGAFGHMNSSGNVLLKNCSSDVKIDAPYGGNCGGFIGTLGNGNLSVDNCFATGDVTGRTQVGGFIGIVEPNAKGSFVNTFSESNVKGTDNYCGGLIGWIQSKSEMSFTKCYSKSNVESTGSSIGGLVGGVFKKNDSTPVGKVVFDDCYAKGTIKGDGNVGGLFGNFASATGSVKNSHFDGSVNGRISLGGISGSNSGPLYENCHAKCAIIGSGNNAAGIIGYSEITSVQVKKCSYVGDITAFRHLGGIVGRCAIAVSISDCWSGGNYTATGTDTYLGGIMPYSNSAITITNCFTESVLNGDNLVGGVCGNPAKSSNISNCIVWGMINNVTKQSGSIVGVPNANTTVTNCYYNAANLDVSNNTVFSGNNGAVAPAGATISSLATSLGWSTDVWDLSGDTPKLK